MSDGGQIDKSKFQNWEPDIVIRAFIHATQSNDKVIRNGFLVKDVFLPSLAKIQELPSFMELGYKTAREIYESCTFAVRDCPYTPLSW